MHSSAEQLAFEGYSIVGDHLYGSPKLDEVQCGEALLIWNGSAPSRARMAFEWRFLAMPITVAALTFAFYRSSYSVKTVSHPVSKAVSAILTLMFCGNKLLRCSSATSCVPIVQLPRESIGLHAARLCFTANAENGKREHIFDLPPRWWLSK